MPLSSIQFFKGKISGGPVQLHTVPEGRKAILRDVRLFVGQSAPSDPFALWVQGATGVVGPIYDLYAPPAGLQVAIVDAFIVLEEGDSLMGYGPSSSGHQGADVILSGHQF